MSFYIESGCSARIPFRKVHNSISGLNKELNKYRGFCNVYHSIYVFTELEEKYDYLSGKKYYGPNYESAIINRVVLDMDSFKKVDFNGRKIEYYTEKALEDMRTIRDYLREMNIKREYWHSGGGFYAIYKAQGHPLKLRDYEINLMNNLGIDIDESVIGDTSRLFRVRNSFNFKENRMSFCISLKEEELDLNYEDIHRIASTPRNDKFTYGKEMVDFSNCKIDQEKVELKKIRININNIKREDAENILLKYGWSVDDFCDCVKRILSLNHVGNFLRWEIIKYLKSVVKISFPDCVKVMVSLLGKEGVHSASEKQAKYAYQQDKKFNPDWKLKPLGYCENNCSMCKDLQDIVWRTIKDEKNSNRC